MLRHGDSTNYVIFISRTSALRAYHQRMQRNATELRTPALALGAMCLHNVAMHVVNGLGTRAWFEANGLVFWPTTVYQYLPVHSVWALYWFFGLLLACRVLYLQRSAATCMLVAACLFDFVLHAFDLHGLISYPVIARDWFWSIYWSIAATICIAIVRATRLGGQLPSSAPHQLMV